MPGAAAASTVDNHLAIPPLSFFFSEKRGNLNKAGRTAVCVSVCGGKNRLYSFFFTEGEVGMFLSFFLTVICVT